jgi:periplasmic divalent cation tolerance protein
MADARTVMIYITCKDEGEAERISRALLEGRLVACANMFPIRSLYRWKGKMEDEPEVAVLCKSRGELADDVVRRVRELHSYDVPCVEVVEVTGGSPDFLKWVRDETEK